MDHFRILKILNLVNVGLLAVGTALTIGVLALVALAVSEEPAMRAALMPTAAATGLSLLPVVGFGVLALASALTLASGRGRVPQTLLAIGALFSFPLGTAYGIYALWVCWYNPETKARFVPIAPAAVAAWVSFSALTVFGPLVPLIALSIATVIPTDLAALDAQWEPIEDRSLRRPPTPGCGLTEVSTADGCVGAAPTGVRTEEVTFPTRGQVMGFSALRGTLYVPEGLEGPRPAVILLHGSGPTDRHATIPGEIVRSAYGTDLPLFDALADDLARQGLVVLSWDKRSCGRCYPAEHADADYTAFRFAHYLDDARAAIDFLATRPEVDGRAVVVIGHSEGGGLAPHVAAADDRVVAVVMLAGLTSTFRETLTGQLRSVADLRRARWDYLQAWSMEGMRAGYAECLNKLDGAYDPDDMCVGGGTTLRAVAEYDALNRSTPAVLGALRVPLFAAGGTVDRNVDPSQLLAVRDARPPDAEIHLVAGMGHGLRDLVEPTDPPQLDAQLVQRLRAFLVTVRRPAP